MQVQRTGYQDIIQTQEKEIKELEKYKRKHSLIKCHYISKDKIKAKIKEYKKQIEELKDSQIFTQTEYEGAINVLQSLLKEE